MLNAPRLEKNECALGLCSIGFFASTLQGDYPQARAEFHYRVTFKHLASPVNLLGLDHLQKAKFEYKHIFERNICNSSFEYVHDMFIIESLILSSWQLAATYIFFI